MDTLKNVISEIIYHIKHDNKYEDAAKIFKANNLTMQQLSSMTFKLSDLELAKLADAIKQSK